ncbi:MAG: transcription-repair coupling factor [Bacteroidota bacterium]
MIRNPYIIHPLRNEVVSTLKEPAGKLFHLKGLSGSSKAAFIHAVISGLKGTHLIIFEDKEEAAYFYTDLVSLEGTADRTLFFPSSYKRSVQYNQTDEANIITRTQTLKRLSERRVASFIITYAEALIEKVITKKELNNNTLQVKEGDRIDRTFMEEVLQTYNFELVDFVYEPGQYSIRGSIVDIFSFAASQPYRIDFFGDEVESIRSFDVDTQLSNERMSKISVIPNMQWEATLDEKRISFLEYIPAESLLWIDNTGLVLDHIGTIFDKTVLPVSGENQGKSEFLAGSEETAAALAAFPRVEFHRQDNTTVPVAAWTFNTTPQPAFNKNFELLASVLKENDFRKYTNYILSESEKQIERLRAIFNEIDPGLPFETVSGTVHEGFTDHDLKISVFTDHQIFERYHKFRLNDHFSRKESISLKELLGLNPGDYVVHVDHGIGIFGGLEKIVVNGKVQESVRLVYRDQDVLYVNIHSLHRISKYKGKDGEAPRVYKLGSGAWQKLKQTTKKKVKDIAQELIALYAKRRAEQGFAFSPDTYLQRELEASFLFEDTPDQFKATNDVKEAMEAPYPMDALVCGDVGFGKTEVAIRAAFKAVSDSKQVAVLVPTTILAFQHYNTFRERLKGFPCNVAYISRLRSAAEQKKILNQLEKGEIDIIIGTHKLVGKEVKFKDLGLLIIDEEQKFGVSVKERLKQMKLNVDTLTLTATPIPRTLQFSLMGARDLSIINTPPPNRHPIITELHPFNEEIIRVAISYEVNRGGQVFLIHNRVQNIGEVKIMIDKLVPGVRSIVAHGQMDGKTLENTMLEFMMGDYDVLIATTIIESGLDIPNANTIIINNAHQFGLSELHQLRGRVGRSNKKAFCYLFSPPLSVLTPEARRRLKAIEEFSSLGSGFNIAMQDLDIRGAGNLLGAEQSGFIADIGYETYQKILNEAMAELREGEFRELFEKPDKPERVAEVSFVPDCHIDTDFELLLPEEYIRNVSERISLYRQLDEISTDEELNRFSEMLTDRFGKPPAATEQLMLIVRLRRLAMRSGVEKIVLKKSTMIVYFVSNPEARFYRTELFQRIIANIQRRHQTFRVKEENEKLSVRIDRIGDVAAAIRVLEQMVAEQPAVQP